MMHQSEFDAANVMPLSRAADKRKSLINIHKNRYTAHLKMYICNPVECGYYLSRRAKLLSLPANGHVMCVLILKKRKWRLTLI